MQSCNGKRRNERVSMAMRYSSLFLLILAASGLSPCVCSVAAQTDSRTQLILIDGSGSMAGFFKTGEIERLHQILRGHSGSLSYYFIDETLSGAAPVVFGEHTYLNKALSHAISEKPSIVWMVTDNQPSVSTHGSQSEADLDRFYGQLGSDAVRRIYLFPLRLRFQGTLYTETDAVLKGGYNGPRGLLVYALLLDAAAQDAFEEAVNHTEQRLRQVFNDNLRAIFIKPLRQNTITSRLLPGKGFRPVGEGIVGRDFEEGKPIQGHFVLELTSQMGQIALEKAGIVATKQDRFQTGDFTVDNIDPFIDPKTIDLQPKDTKRFEVSLRLDAVHMRKNLKAIWNCMTHNYGVIHGHISITISAPKENLGVGTELANQLSTDQDVYHNPSQVTQSRIYRLSDLVRRMVPTEDIIQPQIGSSSEGRIPVQLEVRYPFWPKLVVFGGILMPLLLLAGTNFWVKRQPLYRLTWDNGKARACPDFRLWPFVAKAIEIDKRTAARIRLSPISGITVKSQREYRVDEASSKSINSEGAEFVLARNSGVPSVAFVFAAVGMSNRRAVRSRAALGEDTYNGGGYSEGLEDSTGDLAPPIRRVTTAAHTRGDSVDPSNQNNDLDSLYN